MNELTMRKIGRVLRMAHMHRLNGFFQPRGGIRVTFTHQVKHQDENHFASLVQYLSKSFRMIAPARFFSLLNDGQKLKERFLLMTFDDGLLSSYRAAQNILSKFNIKAIFFIPTQILELKSKEDMKKFISQNVYFEKDVISSLEEDDYLTMGKQEIMDLHRQGHMILPHTHSHCRLKEICDEAMVEAEIVKPKQILSNLLQCNIDAMAFPVGTERVVGSYCFPAIKRQYRYCFSGLAGLNTPPTDPHFLHRDCVHAHYSLEHVQNLTDGVFDAYYIYKMFRLKQGLRG